MSNYGYFDDENREYVVTNPKTPVKWINYLGTLEFGGIIDQTGGALLCKGDPALNRILKYIPQLPASDFKGQTMYLRVENENGYELLAPFFVPVLKEPDSYQCRVGLGYNRYISDFSGLICDVTVFVPRGKAVEISKVRIENNSGKSLKVDVIPVSEFTHFDALKQFNNADWVPQTMESRAYWEKDGKLILTQCAFMQINRQMNYTSANIPAQSFETDRKNFLGNNEYGSFKEPLSLLSEKLSNTQANRGDNIHATLYELGEIKSGESREMVFLLGQEQNLDKIKASVAEFQSLESVNAALKELKDWWENFLSSMHVETSDAMFNSMINIHNPRQCYITKNWSRYLSLYQLGLGARGIGYRDSSQDVMGVMDRIPEEAMQLVSKIISVQKRDGSAMHQFNPLSMVANEGDSREEKDRPKYYGDDHLWPVISICQYVKETGDVSILDSEVPFYDKDDNKQFIEKGPVKEHLFRALDFSWKNRGKNGIPLLGFADWNDSVNLPTGAQSFFVASLFGKALYELIGLCESMGWEEETNKYQGIYNELQKIFNEEAWDGAWFRRYIDWNGKLIGSKSNTMGQIYCNGQSWPVLAGFPPKEKAETALDSLRERLNTKYGIKLSTPGYNGFDPNIGGVTTYPPGAKENGGIFLHSNPWVIIAECILGRGDRAYEYYSQINPAQKNDMIDIFEVEPYVYPQNILGDEHPQFGLGRNSWLSGTSAWMYVAATQYILGIRPHYNQLIIDPCIPKEWDSFKVMRKWRGITFNITVQNPQKVSSGVTSIQLNGQTIPDWISLEGLPETCDVVVTLGEGGRRHTPIKESLSQLA